MLSRECDLQKEIATFLRQFFDPRWLARLALLGKDSHVTDMHAHITAFEVFASRFLGVRPIVGQAVGCGLRAVYRPFDFPVDDASATCRFNKI